MYYFIYKYKNLHFIYISLEQCLYVYMYKRRERMYLFLYINDEKNIFLSNYIDTINLYIYKI